MNLIHTGMVLGGTVLMIKLAMGWIPPETTVYQTLGLISLVTILFTFGLKD